MSYAARKAIDWVEQGHIPDAVVRRGIRRLCEQRLGELGAADCMAAGELGEAFVAAMATAPTAPLPELANAQHYELPAEFFALALGPHRKYSNAWWPEGVTDLPQAEAAALAATCERAGLRDGQQVLELGLSLIHI